MMVPCVEVCWLLSPIRSGSSVTVYAAADALGCSVADEIFGPWDRTGPPYNYPEAQRMLRNSFVAGGERLTVQTVELAGRIFQQLGGPDGVLVCKHPHASIGPDEIRRHWPGHHCAVLMRNPLRALNSLFVRGWEEAAGGGSMIGYFATLAERWLADPHRLLYEDLQRDPCGYFRRLFRAWGFGPDEGLVQRAVRYRECAYHSSSGEKHAGDDPSRVRSEREWRVPEAIVDEYLAHPLMR
ncbi:MAG TPA: hypothetical protein VFF69_09690, partial [Phycisphaerales bacterium]|nr:hypothetical protein [Phycisphaerales bacterium]